MGNLSVYRSQGMERSEPESDSKPEHSPDKYIKLSDGSTFIRKHGCQQPSKFMCWWLSVKQDDCWQCFCGKQWRRTEYEHSNRWFIVEEKRKNRYDDD